MATHDAWVGASVDHGSRVTGDAQHIAEREIGRRPSSQYDRMPRIGACVSGVIGRATPDGVRAREPVVLTQAEPLGGLHENLMGQLM